MLFPMLTISPSTPVPFFFSVKPYPLNQTTFKTHYFGHERLTFEDMGMVNMSVADIFFEKKMSGLLYLRREGIKKS